MQTVAVSVYETIIGDNGNVAITVDHSALRDWPDWPKSAVRACIDDADGSLALQSPSPFHGSVKFVDFPVDTAAALLKRGGLVLARFDEDGKIETHECMLIGIFQDA